jgi:hypothetical protein
MLQLLAEWHITFLHYHTAQLLLVLSPLLTCTQAAFALGLLHCHGCTVWSGEP